MADVAAPPVPADRERDPLLGRVVDGRYAVTGVIARGGMSRVYRAEQAPLGRVVALKVLQMGNGGEQDIEFRNRFTLEASACARLTHPNTVRVFDHGQVGDELLYIAMEFLDGRTLHQVVRAEAPLAAERIVAIARQICGSLREAHSHGLLHRDLKPANVVLVQHGDDAEVVKVVDFGLVKQMRVNDELTGTDAVVGSPSYMSPEQIRAERLDARSDVYSLGVILYAMATGRAPFVSDTSVGVLLAHLNQAPPEIDPHSPSVARCRTLDWVIRTCLAKRPEDRFESVDELNRALRLCEAELRGEVIPLPTLVKGRLERGESPVTRSPAPPTSSSTLGEPSVSTVVSAIRSRRVPILAATGLVAVLGLMGVTLIVGALGWYWYQGAPATPSAAAIAPVPPNELAAFATGVRLTAVPSNALVSRGGGVLGTAPLDVPIPEGEVWTFDVSSAGYQSATVTIPWDTRRQQVVLKPLAAAKAGSASSTSSDSAAAVNVSPGPDGGPAPSVNIGSTTTSRPVRSGSMGSAASVPANSGSVGPNASAGNAPVTKAVSAETVAPSQPAAPGIAPDPPPAKKKSGNDLRDPWEQ